MWGETQLFSPKIFCRIIFQENSKNVLTNPKSCDIIVGLKQVCECSSMVEFQPSKLVARVRFPSLAPFLCTRSSAG